MYTRKEKLIMEDDYRKSTWDAVSVIINDAKSIKNLNLDEALRAAHDFRLMKKNLEYLSYAIQVRLDNLNDDGFEGE